MTPYGTRTELNLRVHGSFEYEAVECIEIADDLAAFVKRNGQWDIAMTLSGYALGFRFPDLETCERAARRIEGEQLFTGDPDLETLFERAGGRSAFLNTINRISMELEK